MPIRCFRIGSISKVFCGEVLASLVLDGKVRFADRLQDRLGYGVTLPEKDGRAIRLIDLATHASGLPREVPAPRRTTRRSLRRQHPGGTDRGSQDRSAAVSAGTAALYSNYGFDLLGSALANAGGKPYADLLRSACSIPPG